MNFFNVFIFIKKFQNRRMKWKRSRKAQQESKNKDNHNGNNDDKPPRDRSTSNSTNQPSAFKSDKVNLTSNNFHFPKNLEAHSHLPPHPAISQQRHLNSLPGISTSKDNGTEENYPNNLIRQPSVFGDSDDMIWRVV